MGERERVSKGAGASRPNPYLSTVGTASAAARSYRQNLHASLTDTGVYAGLLQVAGGVGDSDATSRVTQSMRRCICQSASATSPANWLSVVCDSGQYTLCWFGVTSGRVRTWSLASLDLLMALEPMMPAHAVVVLALAVVDRRVDHRHDTNRTINLFARRVIVSEATPREARDSRSLSGIGETSVGVAVLRAKESGRPDRLFEDPYAQCFLDAAGADTGKWAVEPSDGMGFFELMAEQVAVRTRFLDEALLDAAGDGCGQVVLLASGMDARPYRLGWPRGTRLFEVDFADVLRFKRGALAGSGAAPQCRHVEVAADLREDWPEALREAGFRPDVPTAWLAEGIFYGLPAEAADLLLARVTGLSAPGSELAADHAEDSEVLRAARAAISQELVEMWRGGPTGDLDAWLQEHGWAPAVHDIRAIADTYERPTPAAFDPTLDGTGRGWLITARLPEEES